MRSFREIKNDYRFSADDEKRLADMRSLMEEHVDEVMSTQDATCWPSAPCQSS